MDQTYSGAWDFRDTRASRRETVERLDRLSKFLDTALVIPGTGVRFGADAVIGLVPGVGDAITTAMSCWIIYEAHRLGVPRWLIWRMAGSTASWARCRSSAIYSTSCGAPTGVTCASCAPTWRSAG
jgi:hypothetical protein